MRKLAIFIIMQICFFACCAKAEFNFDEKCDNLNNWSGNNLNRVTADGVFTFSGTDSDDNISLESAPMFFSNGDVVFSFDNFRYGTALNQSAAYFQIGFGDGLALRLTTSGDLSKLMYNGTAYDLINKPICVEGNVGISVHYNLSNNRVAIIQSSGKFKNSLGIIYIASDTVLYDGLMPTLFDNYSYNKFLLKGMTQWNGGYSTITTIDNIKINVSEKFFFDSCSNTNKWIGFDFGRVNSSNGKLTFTGGDSDYNIKLDSKYSVLPGNLQISFTSLKYSSGWNQSIAPMWIGLGQGLAIGITGNGTGGKLVYNGAIYDLSPNYLPMGSYGELSLIINYIRQYNRVIITQTSGKYFNTSANNVGTAGFTEIYRHDFEDKLRFDKYNTLEISAATQYNGGFSPNPCEIDNIKAEYDGSDLNHLDDTNTGDLNGDGLVDFKDLMIMISEWLL